MSTIPKLDQEPRLIGESSPLIEWARRVAKAVNALIDYDDTQDGVIAPLTQGWQPGDFKFAARTSTPAGWIPASTTTIGNAGSGAAFADASALALFTLWWAEFTNAQLPILTSAGGASTRGASAAADWAALKRITAPTATDRYIRTSGASAPTTLQADAIKAHTHNVGTSGNGPLGGTGNFVVPTFSNVVATDAGSTTGATETRPVTLVLQGFWKL